MLCFVLLHLCLHLDVNECVNAVLNGVLACMDESMLCMNTMGSFICSCPGNTVFNVEEQQCREPVGECTREWAEERQQA